MDEASTQLLHELYHLYSTTSHVLEMASASASTPSPPDPGASQIATPQTSPVSVPAFPRSPIDAIHSSLITGRFSDLLIIHGSRKWSAHKLVVCSQSMVLESLIAEQEDKSILDLTAYPPEATNKTMEYLYTGTYTYTDSEASSQPPSFSLPLHTSVFHLAAKLQIPGLAHLAIHNFRSTLVERVQDLDVYFAAVLEVYGIGNVGDGNDGGDAGEGISGEQGVRGGNGLKYVVVEVAVVEMERFLGELKVRRRFFEVMNACPDFQTNVLRGLMRTRPVEMEVQILCPECGAQPPQEPYEILLQCRGCGKEKGLEFF